MSRGEFAPVSASTGIDRHRGGPDQHLNDREIMTMTEQYRWFVGVDWASRTHQVCQLDGDGGTRAERGFAHDGAGLERATRRTYTGG